MSDQPPLTPPSAGPPPSQPWPGYAAPGPGRTAPEAGPVPPVLPDAYRGSWDAPTHPLAVTSLVLGITGLVGVLLTPVLGFTLVAALGSPFAIWLGVRSRREIRADPRAHGGEGLALAGLVTGIVGLVLAVVVLLLVVALVALVVTIFASVG